MSKLFDLVIVCLVLFSVLSVYITIPHENNFAKFSDEGYYFKFAKFILEKGIIQFPFLIKRYVEEEELHLFPTPSRFGHILLTAFWFKIFGISFVSLAKFSFFCYILFLIVCFYFSKKYFGKDIAYFFTLLLSTSPLIMAMGRRALIDSSTNLFWGLSVWLFFDFLIQRKKVQYFLFLLFYFVSLTIKESSVLLWIFFIIFFFIYKYVYKQEISNNYLYGIIFFPFILLSCSYFFLFGGLNNTVSLIRTVIAHHFGSHPPSEYALLFCTGPWYKYIIDYLLLTPITMILSIGYFFHTLSSKKFEYKVTFFMTYFVIIFTVLSNLRYTKVVRFIINLDMVINLFSVLMLYELFKLKNRSYVAYFVLISCIIIFFINHFNFMEIFIYHQIYDPVSYWLLKVKRFIP
jgi:4-amino-4-deoxy-L-arabinose transferase-like glycosyltransferase